MSEELKDMIMSQIRKDVMGNTLKEGSRFDGRAFDEYRGIDVQKSVITTAEGSAVAKIGETQVLVAAKFDVVKPFPDRPKLGVMISNAELLPAASPIFEPGPPNENSIEVARVVDRAIRSAECIDLESFYIAEDKVLGLFFDVYVLNHAGNFMDAATLAATAAMLDAKIPKVEDGAIVRGESKGPLNPTSLPLTTNMVKVGDNWLVDPTRDEERVADTVLTIGTTEEHVCAMQKGKGSLSKQELLDNVDLAFKRGNDIRKILKGVE
jgi:exosome complex component RRP42